MRKTFILAITALLCLFITACPTSKASDAEHNTRANKSEALLVETLDHLRSTILRNCRVQQLVSATRSIEICTRGNSSPSQRALRDFNEIIALACQGFEKSELDPRLPIDTEQYVQLIKAVRNGIAPTMSQLQRIGSNDANDTNACYCYLNNQHVKLVEIIQALIRFANNKAILQEFGLDPYDDPETLKQPWAHIVRQLACCRN